MRNLTMACGLVLAAASLSVSGLATRSGASGARYVMVAPAQAEGENPVEAKPADEPKEATGEELAERAYAALDKNCGSCHGAGQRLNKLVAVDRASHSRLIEEQEAVVPGKPDESPLYTRMLDPKRPMPPARVPQKPTVEEIEAIRLWIEKGAPAPKEKAKEETKEEPAQPQG